MQRRHILALAASTFGSAVLAQPAGTPFPGKPLRLVVGFPAGGAADVLTRVMGTALGKHQCEEAGKTGPLRKGTGLRDAPPGSSTDARLRGNDGAYNFACAAFRSATTFCADARSPIILM